MIIFNSLEDIKNIDKTAVALGNFDGIHIGHQTLIRRAVDIARESGVKSAVFTFSSHPKNVLAGRSIVKNIIYEDEKIEILESMGVDYLFNINFDEHMMKQSPEEFVDEILIKKFRVHTAVCGFNFTYGYMAGGTSSTLEAMACGRFRVCIIEPVIEDGTVVSSSFIRSLIAEGRVDVIREYLGRNYTIRGTVVKGNQLGRTIGFPTCNITIDNTMAALPNGVYVTYCHVRGRRLPAVTNVGNKPTVGEYAKNIETNILDFSENIYGENITVEFLIKIRDEQKFSGIDALQEQIKHDMASAREFFNY